MEREEQIRGLNLSAVSEAGRQALGLVGRAAVDDFDSAFNDFKKVFNFLKKEFRVADFPDVPGETNA